MIQPILKKKAADAIGELINMARLHRTNGDTAAADEFAGFAEVVRELAAEVKRLEHMGASILKTAKQANQLSSDILDERNQVLAERDQLKAKIERISKRLCTCRDCGGRGEIYAGSSTYQGQFQPPEPDMDVCGTCDGDGVLGTVEDFEAIAAERDQFKAELDKIKTMIGFQIISQSMRAAMGKGEKA